MLAGAKWFKRIWSLAGRGLPGGPQLPNYDNADDNRDDSGPVNYARYSPKTHLSCLITAPACSWQCGGLRSLADRLTPYWTAASRSLANGNALVSALERYPAPACDAFTASIARSQPVS